MCDRWWMMKIQWDPVKVRASSPFVSNWMEGFSFVCVDAVCIDACDESFVNDLVCLAVVGEWEFLLCGGLWLKRTTKGKREKKEVLVQFIQRSLFIQDQLASYRLQNQTSQLGDNTETFCVLHKHTHYWCTSYVFMIGYDIVPLSYCCHKVPSLSIARLGDRE